MEDGSLTEGDEQGLANPEEDEDLKWAKENGFGATLFMASCVSRGDDGSVIAAAPLPVGAGRHLECTSYGSPRRSTAGASSVDGEPWCVLGELTSHEAEGDGRLSVQVSDAPENGPWTLVATSNTPVEISPASFGGLGEAWPIWISGIYRTLDLQPEQQGKTCEELFGL